MGAVTIPLCLLRGGEVEDEVAQCENTLPDKGCSRPGEGTQVHVLHPPPL